MNIDVCEARFSWTSGDGNDTSAAGVTYIYDRQWDASKNTSLASGLEAKDVLSN
jgi:hypothetical protein